MEHTIPLSKRELETSFVGRLRKQDRYYQFDRDSQVLFPIAIIATMVNRDSSKIMGDFLRQDVIGKKGWFRVYIGPQSNDFVQFSELDNFIAVLNDNGKYNIKATYKDKEVLLYNPPLLSDRIAGMIKRNLTKQEEKFRICKIMEISVWPTQEGVKKKIISKLSLDHLQPISLYLFRDKLIGKFDELIELNDALWNDDIINTFMCVYKEEYIEAVKKYNTKAQKPMRADKTDFHPFSSPDNYVKFVSFVVSSNSKEDADKEGKKFSVKIPNEKKLKVLNEEAFGRIGTICDKVLDKLKEGERTGSQMYHPLREQLFDLQLMSADENSGRGNISTLELSLLWEVAESKITSDIQL